MSLATLKRIESILDEAEPLSTERRLALLAQLYAPRTEPQQPLELPSP